MAGNGRGVEGVDLLVVGGGEGGETPAMDLARTGRRVAVVERGTRAAVPPGDQDCCLRRAREARRLTALPHTRTSCQTPLLFRERSKKATAHFS